MRNRTNQNHIRPQKGEERRGGEGEEDERKPQFVLATDFQHYIRIYPYTDIIITIITEHIRQLIYAMTIIQFLCTTPRLFIIIICSDGSKPGEGGLRQKRTNNQIYT